jgi:simple sugar transport system ATP-binding protein
MISGVYAPDEGEIYFTDKRMQVANPREALEMGIETIYQDLALAENLNVYSNIFLGREHLKKFLGFIPVLDHEYMHQEALSVLERLDIHIPALKSRISTLSGGQRQAVAISRSIYWDARVLIMDEPTAALGITEQKKVLDLVRSLKKHGLGVIIISHQLHDVFSVADRIVVMRRGKQVADLKTAETGSDEIVKYIVGAETVES